MNGLNFLKDNSRHKNLYVSFFMYLILTAMLNIQYVLDLLDYSRSNLLKDPFTFILVSLRDLLRHNFSQIFNIL